MKIIKKNIPIFVAIMLLIVSGILYVYFGHKENKEIKTGIVMGKIAYDDIDKYLDGIMLAKKGKNHLIIDLNDKVIEKIDKNAKDIKILYGGYYTYTLDNTVYLNRNGKNIKTFDPLFNEEFTLYKDDSDESSQYIAMNYKKLAKDIYYVTTNDDNNITTTIYNSKTGKRLYKTNNYISLLKTPSDKLEYFVVGDKELVRLSDYKTVFKETDVNIVGDTNRADVSDDIVTNSSKYLVISNVVSEDETKKYGLIDLEGNTVIPLSYEDLFFKTDNSTLISAKKDGKYGLINTLDEQQLDFSYDTIEVYNNNIVLVKDNRLGIMDKDLNIIYNYKLGVSSAAYNSRECCSNTNAFDVFVDDQNLIISTYPKNEEEQKELTFNNTLIVNQKNEVTELKKKTIKYIVDNNEIIDSKYLIKEKIDDSTLNIDFFDTTGVKIANYEMITSESINSVSYELYNEKELLITIYNQELKELYKCLINPTTGKVLVEQEEIADYLKKQLLVDGYYFYGKNNKITISDLNNNKVINIDGKDLKYLNGSYYAIKSINNKYYISKILLEQTK